VAQLAFKRERRRRAYGKFRGGRRLIGDGATGNLRLIIHP
jgi:hypothetical protein